jgi:hypothetical protein
MVFQDANGQFLFTHSALECLGRPCTVHRPSDHHMAAWPQVFRHDLRIMLRRCEHHMEHPDPDEFRLQENPELGAHDCDGCCTPAM